MLAREAFFMNPLVLAPVSGVPPGASGRGRKSGEGSGVQPARGREKREQRTPRVNWAERREDTKGHLGLLSCVHSPTRTTRARGCLVPFQACMKAEGGGEG